LLKIIAGLLIPSEGEVYYKEKNLSSMNVIENRKFRKECAFVFQDSALWANQTIAQNLILPLQVHFPKMKQEERMGRIHEVCKEVGYIKDLYVRPVDLSAGEQKKIALARALVAEPQVLFLDECTSSLDDMSAQVVMRLLHQYVKDGNTIIYISHNEKFRWEFPGVLFEVDNGKVYERSIDIDDLR
jgi:ABC-type lipoprotein export system ATPase subunit